MMSSSREAEMSLFHDVPEPNGLASAEIHGARDPLDGTLRGASPRDRKDDSLQERRCCDALLRQLREESRQITNLGPALISLDGCDTKVLEVLVEHRRAFLGEWR